MTKLPEVCIRTHFATNANSDLSYPNYSCEMYFYMSPFEHYFANAFSNFANEGSIVHTHEHALAKAYGYMTTLRFKAPLKFVKHKKIFVLL